MSDEIDTSDAGEASAALAATTRSADEQGDEASAKSKDEAASSSPSLATRRTTSPRRTPKRKASTKKRKPDRGTSSQSTGSSSSAKYPRHSVERALRIPTAIYEQNGGRPATPQQAVEFSGGGSLSGPWRVEISSAKKYGFLDSAAANQLALTDRARK